MSRLLAALADASIKLLSLVVLFVVWWLAALWVGDQMFLPDPWSVMERLGGLLLHEQFVMHAANTVRRVLIGFVVALAIGCAVGIAMGVQRHLESFFEMYVLVGLTIPGLAWAVLALMWFGISEVAPVFAIVAVVTPMLAVNMWEGTKAIDKQLLDMARAFQIRRARIIASVIVPQLVPYILAASRFGFGLGWKVVVLSEIFGLSNGIGYMINRSFSKFSMLDVLAWTFGFTLIMYVFEFALLRPVERRLLRWRPKFQL